MKKINIILYSHILLLCGCIHQYPETADIAPVQVKVSLDVIVDENLLSLPEEARTRTSSDGYERRFIIDVYRNGKVMEEKRTTSTQAGENGEDKYHIPVSIELPASNYTLVAWADYIESGTDKDLSFITTDLGNIPSVHPYPGGSRLREAFYATEELDLTPYRDGVENVCATHTIHMQRTHAHYRIVATDADEFRRILARNNPSKQPEEYRVKVMYEFYFPTAFNALTGVPCGSDTGVEFTLPLSLTPTGGNECELASDYIPANGVPSFVTLTLEVTNEEGKTLSRANGVKVPYKRGCTTTVTGRFLTTLMSGGIDLDTGFEGEYNIDIGDFIK